MKRRIVTTSIAVAISAGQAIAACPHSTGTNAALNNAGIKSAFGGASKFHCAIRGTEKWNESLGTTGNGNNAETGTLTDFKKGASDPVDPTEAVGTWSIANDRIAYNYGSGGTFTYTVREVTAGASYEMCNVATNELFNVTVSTSPSANPSTCP